MRGQGNRNRRTFVWRAQARHSGGDKGEHYDEIGYTRLWAA
jgi:hypothetical protein